VGTIALLSVWGILIAWAQPARAEDISDLVKQAQAALAKGKTDEALKLAEQAVATDDKSAQAHLLRGTIYEALRRHKDAIADFDKTIASDPKAANAYDHRGSERLKLGQFTEAIKDFDTFLKFKPAEEPGHWRRGIAYYYAGRYDEGRKQFEGYEKVDTNDVENAVWHFLCVARKDGVAKARAGLLKIGKDKRVPMMEVYDLFAGKLKPDDVLKAAKTPDTSAKLLSQQMFYAHLYLGVYYEVHGDTKKALEHLEQAVQQRQENHYMWEVARVHRDLRKR